MNRIFAMMLALMLACSPICMAQDMSMDERVDEVFRGTKTVGGAFVVAQHGEIVYERYYGEQQKTTHVPVTEKTYFRGASVTKLVTGIGLSILAVIVFIATRQPYAGIVCFAFLVIKGFLIAKTK